MIVSYLTSTNETKIMMLCTKTFPLILISVLGFLCPAYGTWPVVITTWGFRNATESAWKVLQNNGSALDAIEQGCMTCERLQCDHTVGYGGSPDENGETTLDSMIMDGATFNVGAVASLRNIKPAISVARKVLEHTTHSILAGELASQFALSMGFVEESLTTAESKEMWLEWRNNNCQPNYWTDVTPDSNDSCGPYKPKHLNDIPEVKKEEGKNIDEHNHDTIGMVAIDETGHMVAGTSTNGLKHKIPGRVGDSPIPGSGAYAVNNVGGAAATGDGDVMLRFLPSYQAVESMRQGHPPAEAAKISLERIIQYYPKFEGAVVAMSKDGMIGAACFGLPSGVFPFSVASKEFGKVVTMSVDCLHISNVENPA